jgi:hypothetical protein
MLQARRVGGLALESRLRPRIVGQLGQQHLDRVDAVQPSVAAQIYQALAARTDQLEHLVVNDA